MTGAYGFIGRHVARQLNCDGWRVIGLGHGSWNREEWQSWGISEWHTADVTLNSLITYGGKPDVILHCAGSGSVGFSMMYPHQDFQRTVETTIAVLEYVRMYAPRARVAFPSSGGVYGEANRLPISETDSISPASPYGVHKRMAEELCESYARHFGVTISIVRLFSVYGAGLRKQLLWDASHKIMSGNMEFFGTGEEIRDWLHVEDAARLLITATAYASAACPLVNGGAGEGISVRNVLADLIACFNRDVTPKFSGVARDGDPAGYLADISLARKWKWQPTISLSVGLREYAEWFQSSVP